MTEIPDSTTTVVPVQRWFMAFCLCLATAIPLGALLVEPKFEEIFRDFLGGVQLPLLTSLVVRFHVPMMAGCLLVGVGALAVTSIIRRPAAAFALTAAVMAGQIIVGAMVALALIMPLLDIVGRISAP